MPTRPIDRKNPKRSKSPIKNSGVSGFDGSTSGFCEVICALLWSEFVEDGTNGAPEGLAESGSRFADPVLEPGEDLFYRVQVRAVGRQEQKVGASRADRLSHGLALVVAEIVHQHHIAGPERRHQLRRPGGSETAPRQVARRVRKCTSFFENFAVGAKTIDYYVSCDKVSHQGERWPCHWGRPVLFRKGAFALLFR